MDTVKEGVTGFHMGLLDPDKLVDKDAEAVADAIARCDRSCTTMDPPHLF